MSPRNRRTEEDVFRQKINEFNLNFKCETETRVAYGVGQIRLWIIIYREKVFLGKTSSGFMSLMSDYRNVAFLQANRLLNKITVCGHHLPTSTIGLNQRREESGGGRDSRNNNR